MGKVQNLLVQLSIPAKLSIKLQLVNIAFRMYGKTLENTPKEMAYGVDVWVKRTDRLIINERYKGGEYHVDHGDGMDYYHVGRTLGAGGIAPYFNDTIWHSKNYREWKILDNGPIRSTFQLKYDEWIAAGRKVSVTKTISLNAGSQLNKVEAHYNWQDGPLPLVTGIIKRDEAGEILLNEKQGILAYWEPQHGQDETLLQGAAWDKAGRITSAEQWLKYLHQQAELLKNPLNITIQ